MAITKLASCAAVAAVMVVLVAVYAPGAEALTCGAISSGLAPCINYAKTAGTGAPPPACCAGIKKVNGLASTPADRQQACKCLQSASGSIKGLNLGTIAALPGKCKVSIPYKISPSTKCDSVH